MVSRVREGEKGFRERNRGDQWTIVNQKKPPNLQPSTSASGTIFINFLPSTISPHEISNIFRPYGKISNIHIPHNPNPESKPRFAFVKFYSSQSL